MDRYLLISSDCHAGAPWYVYRKYLDAQYRDAYDSWLDRVVQISQSMGETQQAKERPFQLATMSAERQREYLAGMEQSMGHLGNWDPVVRAKELDREGVAGEVVFCDGSQKNYPPFGVGFVLKGINEISSYEHRLAGCRAHNRWLAEFCQSNPGRHAGVALVTMDNPEDTVKEITWCRENGLFGGIMLPGLKLDTNGYESFWHHPRYEPIWAACEDLEMPVTTHASATGIDYGGSPQIHPLEVGFVTFRPFWMLLWGGVFERHPKLKFCPTESGGLLMLWVNGYLDEYLVKNRRPEDVKKAISMKPSDYWHRQCFVGASAHSSRLEIDYRYQIGVENILWGSDYPHPEGTWPVSRERIRTLFAGIPDAELRLMLGENAAKVYRFDLDQMNAIAAKIGPTLAEINGDAAVAG